MLIEVSATLRPIKLARPMAVALVGFGPSMRLMYDLPPDIPIWTLNAVEEYDFPRLDRAFEMHPLRDVILETPRWERLQQELPYPTYMLETDPRIPSAVAYPLEAVLDLAFANIVIGDEPACYLDSSFPYMLALAVLEGYKTIHVFGFEFRSDTEYRYQRPGAALLVGWAAGVGVKVILPGDTGLLPHTLYGYEDYQMISRQNLEQFLSDLQTQESDWQGKLNVAHARVLERSGNGNADVLQKAEEERAEAFKQMYMRAGAIHAITHLIAICDRKETALVEMPDPFAVYQET